MDHGDEVARAVPIQRRDLADVGAADKSALAGAGRDQEANPGVRGELVGGLDDLGHQRAIEAVQLGRIVDRKTGDMAACGTFLELGPGRVLSGLVRQIEPTAEVFAADSPAKLAQFGAARA